MSRQCFLDSSLAMLVDLYNSSGLITASCSMLASEGTIVSWAFPPSRVTSAQEISLHGPMVPGAYSCKLVPLVAQRILFCDFVLVLSMVVRSGDRLFMVRPKDVVVLFEVDRGDVH